MYFDTKYMTSSKVRYQSPCSFPDASWTLFQPTIEPQRCRNAYIQQCLYSEMNSVVLTSSICRMSVSVALSEMFPTNTVVATFMSAVDKGTWTCTALTQSRQWLPCNKLAVVTEGPDGSVWGTKPIPLVLLMKETGMQLAGDQMSV